MNNMPSTVPNYSRPYDDSKPPSSCFLHINTEDLRVTREIVNAGKLLSVDVLDHIVIGHNRYTSLKERGIGFD